MPDHLNLENTVKRGVGGNLSMSIHPVKYGNSSLYLLDHFCIHKSSMLVFLGKLRYPEELDESLLFLEAVVHIVDSGGQVLQRAVLHAL